MPFDSFMTAALTLELRQKIVGLKVGKICQPERDEIDLVFGGASAKRLVINCSASTPYVALSSETKENPASPPVMCMLLRKHLTRARVSDVSQIGFDRILCIRFDADDEMGFRKTKCLYCEMMGRGSNLIFVDENDIILASFRQNDVTTKFGRIVMPGVRYQSMPPRDLTDPTTCDRATFDDAFLHAPADGLIESWIRSHFSGFGKLTACEAAYLAAGKCDAALSDTTPAALWNVFSGMIERAGKGDFSPALVFLRDGESGAAPVDFSCFDVHPDPVLYRTQKADSASSAIESFYLERDRQERRKQHYNDIYQILKTCRNRLEKKIAAQKQQLEDARDADDKKRMGDLILQEMYRIRRGDRSVTVTDYALTPPAEVTIALSDQLNPSQNAQQYYREYAKKKTAAVKLCEQIAIAEEELAYADSILATLSTAQTASDLAQIRQELSHWNYGRRLATGLKKPNARDTRAKPREFRTSGGQLVYVGMNHYQNDTVTFSLADKDDLWFHVKTYHGSHVLLKQTGEAKITDRDLEEAASLAAYYSEAGSSPRVEVDYTRARYVKKPSGAKPGFVTYRNQKTVFVSPKKEITPKA